jgi:hypothetical protein
MTWERLVYIHPLASIRRTVSPTLNRDAALAAFTTLPAKSRPLMHGKAGSPNPKSLEVQ